jgi:hypothetical protein
MSLLAFISRSKLLQKGNIVQNSYAVRGADPFDNFVPQGFVAGAKNIGVAHDGSLQNSVVVRVSDNGRKNLRQLRQNACRFQ